MLHFFEWVLFTYHIDGCGRTIEMNKQHDCVLVGLQIEQTRLEEVNP